MHGKSLLTLVILITICTVANAQRIQHITYNEQPKEADSLEIHEGILCKHAMKIKYKRNGKKVATIELSEPVMIAMADQEEPWGYFQFPGIGVSDDGTLRISWQMQADSHKTYGKSSSRKYTPMVSKNKGKTWQPQDKIYKVRSLGYNILMSNGEQLHVSTPAAKSINSYTNFPKPFSVSKSYAYYKEKELPADLQGFYLLHVDAVGQSSMIHTKLNDPGLLRYAIDGEMPIVWWGNIKEMADHSLVAGVYPTNYDNGHGGVTRGSVSYYQSKDGGRSWDVLSRIPFLYDGIANVRGNMSFDEPAFEVLSDSSFLCVMRSGATSPMYRCFSTNRGKTWSTPEPFTPNGVKPMLLTLKNGAIVLASGRPGLQIRVSFDGGHQWTDAIDMIPFMHDDGTFKWDVSCGYASILEAGKNSFYLVYSDFTTKNVQGETRKSIWFRKISLNYNQFN